VTFVKAADTSVPVARSQHELERILRRYGASGFGTQSDYEKGIARVFFRVPDGLDGPTHIPIRLEVNIKAIADRLTAGRKRKPVARRKWVNGRMMTFEPKNDMEQAERVAWRHLVVWVDASLSAVAAGLQKVSEAFLAHTLVRGDKGQVIRIIDQLDLASGGDWRLRLAPPKEGA
jgi:hypothetical protein